MGVSESSEINRLFPGTTHRLEWSGEAIEIKPVPFGKLKVFSDSIASLFARIQELGVENFADPSSWSSLLEVAAEEIVQLESLILGKPLEWFDTISIADGIAIFDIILQQNITESTKKNLGSLIARLGSALQTSSKDSSPTATAEK